MITAEDICREFHKHTVFYKTGSYPRAIKNFDKQKAKSEWVYFERLAQMVDNNAGMINYRIYIEALAKHYRGWFKPSILPSMKAIKIYKVHKTILNSTLQLANGQPFINKATWISDVIYNSAADAINNIWVSLCDIFNYASTINFTITTSSSNTVNLEIDPSNNITAKVQDTGWVNLDGFDWYSGSVDTVGIRPQCRRVGNMIHFRGIAWIPLAVSYGVDDSIIPLTATDTYNSNTGIGPATSGVGSMNIDASGVAYWNNNTRVIPASILDPLENLDGPYRFQYPTVLNRAITVGGNGAILNSAGRFGILSSGVLYFATLKDQEIPASGGSLLKGASPLRYITSNIRSGEYIPNFANTDTDIQNLPAAGVSNLVAESGFPTTGGTDVTWPITCDAAEEDQIGGFYATLEGLTAFVDCNATMATTSCY